jgi:hypothetical protein
MMDYRQIIEMPTSHQRIFAEGIRWHDRAEAAEASLLQALRFAKEIEMHCPCGARPESLTKPDRFGNTYPHVGGCPVEKLLAALSTSAKEGK